MDELEELLRRNRPEDVSWLCSLSASELDMLISLKMLVLQRAKVIGHESLAKKFDLKMLRAMGFILMEYLKGKVKDLSLVSGENAEFMDCCNLLKFSVEEIMSNEEIKACIGRSKKSPAKS
ncbi:uncharacterized protein LOC115988789 [Quercus lobata]|uniref:Uncharacterized protein n=1 Tax=Quercus lobata TaxID=97700 RepID=A0A7N2LSI7_QUELO|nr:uncharacterized protein LOC115988789 [Quercus lobata]XP_030968263.1 uncharacterized protein LOC115988789 [Quercus lobata]XP_030968264.1 uncharacterized protein LOC115988789 [Quercus lobata]